MSTFSQVFIHIVFSTQNRDAVLHKEWRDRLYNYMIAIIQNNKHKVYAIGGTTDHIHILISQYPSQTIPELVAILKRDTSKWIKENRFILHRFAWQEGYGSFSVSYTLINTVINYILNQEEHHITKSSKDEIISFLKKYGIDFDPKYL